MARVRGQARACLEAVPSCSSSLHEKLPAGQDSTSLDRASQLSPDPGASPLDGQPGHRSSCQHGDTQPELILYDSSTDLSTFADPKFHFSRPLLLQCALVYPDAEIAIGTRDGTLERIQSFCLKDMEADSLQPFARAGIIDVIVEAVRSDSEAPTRTSEVSPSGHHQDTSVTPADICSERLIYEQQPHADCLLGCIRFKRRRAGREASFKAQSLFLHIADLMKSGSGCGCAHSAHKHFQQHATQADLPDPDILAIILIQDYRAWLTEQTALHCDMFQRALNDVRKALFMAYVQRQMEAPGWSVLLAASKIPEDFLFHPGHAPRQIVTAPMEDAIAVRAALRDPASSRNDSAAGCPAGSQSRPAAALPQAEAKVLQVAASEPKPDIYLEYAANAMLQRGPAQDQLAGLEDAQLSSSPFSGAACLLLHTHAAWVAIS